MIKRITTYFDKLASDGGPNSSRAINLGVAGILSVCMLWMTWAVAKGQEDVTMWYWACFTTLAVYGMGLQAFMKWLTILEIKAGGSSTTVASSTTSTTEVSTNAGVKDGDPKTPS